MRTLTHALTHTQVKETAATTKRVLVSRDRWVLVASVAILVLSFLLVSLSGYVTNLRQEDIKQAMYTYEQQIFQKKVQVSRRHTHTQTNHTHTRTHTNTQWHTHT